MRKLLTYHEVEYIQKRRSWSPSGAPYGFTNRRDGTLLVESKSILDGAIAKPQAKIGESEDWKYWKFEPDPCQPMRAATFDLVRTYEDDDKYYERLAATIIGISA